MEKIMKNKIFIFSLLSFAFLSTPGYTETLNLLTYYPAPFGAYDRLILVPRDELSEPCDIGTFYVSKGRNNTFQYCEEVSGVGKWGSAGPWTLGLDALSKPIVFLKGSDPDTFVGIGDNEPDAMLEISASGINNDLLMLSSNDDREGDIMIVQNNGMVGIGRTTDLDNQLEVNGDIEIVSDDADSKLRFHDPDDGWYSMGIDQTDGGNFKINFGSDIGETDQFTLSPDGNVTIGGMLKIRANTIDEGDVKVEYVPGAKPGYYATYAP